MKADKVLVGRDCRLSGQEIYKGENATFLFDEMDGSFPNHEPNPLVPKNVEPLKKLVSEIKADVGVHKGSGTRSSISPWWTLFARKAYIITEKCLYLRPKKATSESKIVEKLAKKGLKRALFYTYFTPFCDNENISL